MDTTADTLGRLIACLLVLLLGSVIAVVAKTVVERAPARDGRRGRAVTAGKIVFWSLLFLAVELALDVLEVDSALLVFAGAAVLAFGAYDVLRDLTLPLGAGGVATAIAVVGGFMALDEADVAPRIVNALFLGLVATVAGIAIVAIGGGGIQPMRARWEQAMERWQQRSTTFRTHRTEGIDLRERTPAMHATDMARTADDTTLVPAGDGASTQQRIRAEIRSETDTLP